VHAVLAVLELIEDSLFMQRLGERRHAFLQGAAGVLHAEARRKQQQNCERDKRHFVKRPPWFDPANHCPQCDQNQDDVSRPRVVCGAQSLATVARHPCTFIKQKKEIDPPAINHRVVSHDIGQKGCACT